MQDKTFSRIFKGLLVVFYLAVCTLSYEWGQFVSQSSTGVDIPRVANLSIKGDSAGAGFIKIQPPNTGTTLEITGAKYADGKLIVYVKNTGKVYVEGAGVCWKLLDKDGVVVDKDSAHTEETTMDAGDTTDMIKELELDKRTASIILFPYKKGD